MKKELRERQPNPSHNSRQKKKKSSIGGLYAVHDNRWRVQPVARGVEVG